MTSPDAAPFSMLNPPILPAASLCAVIVKCLMTSLNLSLLISQFAKERSWRSAVFFMVSACCDSLSAEMNSVISPPILLDGDTFVLESFGEDRKVRDDRTERVFADFKLFEEFCLVLAQLDHVLVVFGD